MIVRVLGSAAGGGVPQWNCGCPHCASARAGRIPRRTQSSFAVSSDGEAWWLINVSPDIAQQIEAFEPLQPRALRGSPIAGILLTDANVDHMGGLAVLRQSGARGFTIWSSAVVRSLALEQVAFAPFAMPPHRWETFLDGQSHALDDRLSVSAIAVAGTTPGYAGRMEAPGAVVAIAVADRETGGRLLAAPVFAAVDPVLRNALASADVAFIDGSFYADDELADFGVDGKAARRLGHLPAGGADGSLALLASEARGTRVIYAHLNNTNPLVDPASAAYTEAETHGFAVAEDGLMLTL